MKMVNEKGIAALKKWIEATRNEEHYENLNSRELDAWACEAEESMGNGNPPMVEMKGNATLSGVPETFTLPADCVYEVEED